MIGRPAPLCSTMPAPQPGQAGLGCRLPGGIVTHDHVVVHMGHGPAPFGIGPVGHGTGHDGLEVGHEVPAHQRMVQPRQEQQARRLDGPGGHDHVTRVHRTHGAVGADHVHPGGPMALGADAGHERLHHQFGPPTGHGPLQHGDGIALGVDRTAEVGTEAAVVAGRPPVVGHGVGRGGSRVRVVPEPLGRRTGQDGPVHGCARRHRERTRSGGGEGIGALGAGHPDGPLHLGVVGLELVVADGPVGHVGIGLGPEHRVEAEVVGHEAGHLAVGVGAAPPTVDGTELTSPTWVWSPSPSWVRKVRGSMRGSGPRKWRLRNLISSFE